MQEAQFSFSELQEPVHYDWENAGTVTYTPTPYSSESQPDQSSNTQESQVQPIKDKSRIPSSTSLFQNIQLRTMPASLKKPRKSLLPRLQKNQKEFQDFVASHLQCQRPVTTKCIVAHTLLKDLETLQAHSEERFRAKSAQGLRRAEIKPSEPYLQIQSQSKIAKQLSPRRLKISDILRLSRRATVKEIIPMKKAKKKQSKKKKFKGEPRVLDYQCYSYRKTPNLDIESYRDSKNSKLYGNFVEFRLDNSDSFLKNRETMRKKAEQKSRTLKVEVERKIPRIYSSNSLLKDGKSYIPASIYENELIRRSPSVLFKGSPLLNPKDLHIGYMRRLTGQSSELG